MSSSDQQDLEKGLPNEKQEQDHELEDPILAALEHPQHIQKVVQEAIILGGGAAAILLQVANPGVGKGVNNHSNFAYRPVDRLRTTMTFVYTMTFGTADEKRRVVDMVHRAHAPVKGPDYDADDVGLQLWVAATLYAVAIDLYEQIFGALEEGPAEELYREYAVLAASLRVPASMWPRDRAAFWAYWDEQLAGFEVCDEAKQVASDLLYNKQLPVYLRVLMPTVRLMTAELLPPNLREAYGLKTSKTRKRAYRATMGLTRATYPFLPRFVRTLPKKYYLRDMRKRMAKMGDQQEKI